MTAFDTPNKTAAHPDIMYRRSILIFGLLIFLIGAAGYAIFDQYKNSIIDSEIDNLAAVADLKVAQIVDWRSRQKRRAEFFSNGAMLPAKVEQWMREGMRDSVLKQQILKTMGALRKEQDYKAVLLLNRDGAVLTSTDDQAAIGAEQITLALEAMRSQRVLFSDFLWGSARDKEVVISSVAPLRTEEGKNRSRIIGALLFVTDPGRFLYPTINSWPTHSPSAETLLVRREGDRVLFLNNTRFAKDAALKLSFPLANTWLPAAKAVLGQKEFAAGNDHRGIPVVAVLRSIPDTGWFLVAKVDKEEIFTPVLHLKTWIAGLALFFVACASLLFFFWHRGAQTRYRQLDAMHAAALEREALLKNFEFFSRYANEMIIVADERGQIVEVNDRTRQALGYRREELLQMRIADLHVPLEKQDIPGQLEQLNKAGENRVEGVYQRKDGSTFPVEISAHAIEVEGTRYLHGIVRDTTEQKRAEEKLRMHSTILTNLSEGVFLARNDGVIVFTNSRIEHMLGYGRDELIGKHVSTINAPGESSAEEVAAAIMGALMNAGVWNGEILNIRKDGSTLWCHASVSALEHPEFGTAWVSVHEDISERKRIEAELIAAKEHAEQASHAKSKFLSHMSHELRTPLNSIIGFAEIMEMSDEGETIDVHRDNLKSIIRSGWHLLRIIEDLLNLSAIEAGKVQMNVENVDLGVCLHECFDLMGPLAGQKLIELNFDENEWQEVMVRADAFRLKQVLINLLSNAIKFNKVGGSISIRGMRKAGGIRIQITDSGTGIPEDDLPFLFQPFGRLSKRPYSVEGAGIGLSIAKQLVELMGGTIGVESIYYMGSKFWIELPTIDAETTMYRHKALPEQPVRNDNSMLMLYIEDNPDHVNLVKEIISRMGNLSLITAHTPTLGLDLAWAQRPDLILLDIGLPGMNGYEVLSLLQNSELTRNIPVMAISASANPAEIETGRRAGFKHYFTKPLNVSRFRNTISELLQSKLKA